MFSLDMLQGMVIVYGAGGVAGQFIELLKGRLTDCRIAVSKKGPEAERMLGFSIYGIEELADYRGEAVVIIAATPTYQKEIAARLKELAFEKIYTVDDVMDCVYRELYREPIKKNKILLSNFHGKGYGCNPKYIAEALRKNGGLDIVWAEKEARGGFPEGIRLVKYGSYEHYKELATARVWIDNEHKGYLARKREGQFYIQTWHGCGPLKKVEHDTDKLPLSYMETLDHDMAMADLCLSVNRFTTGQYRRAFRYNGEVAEYGYPRNDIFFDGTDKAPILDRLGIKGGTGLVLYAPTFRKDRKAVDEGLDLKRVVRALEKRDGKEYAAMVRQHPDILERPGRAGAKEGIIDVSEYDDVQELLYVSDVLITDYSSVMWDFSLQGKPVFLYHVDEKAYEMERGFYLPFSEYPYIKVHSNDELEKAVMDYNAEGYLKDLKGFFGKYPPFDRGGASEKTAERIMEIISDGR